LQDQPVGFQHHTQAGLVELGLCAEGPSCRAIQQLIRKLKTSSNVYERKQLPEN